MHIFGLDANSLIRCTVFGLMAVFYDPVLPLDMDPRVVVVTAVILVAMVVVVADVKVVPVVC